MYSFLIDLFCAKFLSMHHLLLCKTSCYRIRSPTRVIWILHPTYYFMIACYNAKRGHVIIVCMIRGHVRNRTLERSGYHLEYICSLIS